MNEIDLSKMEFIEKTKHDLIVLNLESRIAFYKNQYEDFVRNTKTVMCVASVDKHVEKKDVEKYKRRQMIMQIAEKIYPVLEKRSYQILSDEMNDYYKLTFSFLDE